MNLYDQFSVAFPKDSSTVFLEHVAGQTVTYRELERTVDRLADKLIRLGVNEADRVLVKAQKSPNVIFLYLACLKLGVIFVPINPEATAAETEYFISQVEPRLVVCDPQWVDTCRTMHTTGLPPYHIQTLSAEGAGTLVEDLTENPAALAPAQVADEAIAAILFTSGTTGKPKGAMLSHRNLRSNAQALVRHWGFGSTDVLIHALPIFHTHGLFVACHCVLMSGARMIFFPKFDLEGIIARLPDATVLMGVPTFYTRLLSHTAFNKSSAAGLRLFISGSAPLASETFLEFEQRTGQRILERYGMTETNMITSNPLAGQRIAGSVGRPLPGVAVRICGSDGRPVEAGEIGAIQVKGDNVFSGYWKRPEMREKDFTADGYFITGDLGHWTPEGYLTISGRAKELIISGGMNVYPKEVENSLIQIDGVTEAAVFGVPHADLGEGVVAAVVVASNHRATLTSEHITATLRRDLSTYKVPKAVVFIETLPRNAMGKIQRTVLQEKYKQILS